MNKKTRSIDFSLQGMNCLKDLRTGSKVGLIDAISTNNPFQDFEKVKWQLYEQEENGRKKVYVPRYFVENGNPLCLVQTENSNFVLEDDPDFLLVKPSEALSIFPIENFLCMQNQKTGEIKIIAPCKGHHIKQKDDVNFTGTTSLVEEKKDRNIRHEQKRKEDILIDEELETFSEKAYPIATYQFKEGNIIPKNNLSKIFLGYVFLLQRKEPEALALLQTFNLEEKMLSQTHNMSEEEKVLERMLLSYKKVNASPSGVAISLTAGLELYKISGEKASPEIKKKLFSVLQAYRNNYNNISPELRLSNGQLHALSQIFPKEDFSECSFGIIDTHPSTIREPDRIYPDPQKF
ncbi:MAG: hypothetical protein JSS09_06385, partial [Verrucomicrobia bacterium]|nr:hypothetical protein [Verrucomicrobiota bacterium]